MVGEYCIVLLFASYMSSSERVIMSLQKKIHSMLAEIIPGSADGFADASFFRPSHPDLTAVQ